MVLFVLSLRIQESSQEGEEKKKKDNRLKKYDIGIEPGSQMHPMVVLFELMLTIHIRSCLAIKKIITPFDRVQ